MRAEAERKGIKPSRYVNFMWNKYQIGKHNGNVRRRNQARGTAPRARWKNRVTSVF